MFKSTNFKVIVVSVVTLFVSSCVTTRSDLDPNSSQGSRYNTPKAYNPSKPLNSKGATKPTQEVAALEYQLKSYEEQFRTMLGRIEELETKSSTEGKVDSERVKDLEQALSEMLVQQEQLKKEIKSNRESAERSRSESEQAAKQSNSTPTGNIENADQLFAEGKWAEAVKEFQKYRELNPKSDENAIVTYKIGVCFQELGMKGDAKTFYNNVIKLYPSSKASKFAKFRLDNMK